MTRAERWAGVCNFCGRDGQELRGGCCWDCANNGERKAAMRTVLEHLAAMLRNVSRRKWDHARFDFKWAFERLTRSGDYAREGYFWREHGRICSWMSETREGHK
jgi:hypothetical protein